MQFGGPKWIAIYNSSDSIPQPSVAHGGHDARFSPSTGILEIKLESIMEQPPPPLPRFPCYSPCSSHPTTPPHSSHWHDTGFSLQPPTARYLNQQTSEASQHTFSWSLLETQSHQGQIAQTQVQPRGFGIWSPSVSFLLSLWHESSASVSPESSLPAAPHTKPPFTQHRPVVFLWEGILSLPVPTLQNGPGISFSSINSILMRFLELTSLKSFWPTTSTLSLIWGSLLLYGVSWTFSVILICLKNHRL